MNSMGHIDTEQSFIGTPLLKKSISTNQGPKRSDQYPDDDTQDPSQLLEHDIHSSPAMCVSVPVDTSNSNIVMDL